MGSTSHSYQLSKYKVTSWHNRGGQNQVRGHLDTLPVLFLPSEAYLHTVQTRISKYCPLESWKISYKEQSPFSIPVSTVSKRAETEGKHVNERAHWQAGRRAMRRNKAGEGMHTTPSTHWGHKRFLCPHHQETPLSLPTNSNSSFRVFTRCNSG